MSRSPRTEQSLELRIRQLLLLQETAKKVNSILDLEQLLDEIVGAVAEAFGCNRTAVLLKDETTDELEIIALRGFSNVHLKGYRFMIGGEGIIGHVRRLKHRGTSSPTRKCGLRIKPPRPSPSAIP
jgi:signal transduction protein with GAF and PtsI domain